MKENKTIVAAPFLKWAGGKRQLLPPISKILYPQLKKANTYVEPFVGSGAVLFWVLREFPHLQQVVINDLNSDLINAYKTIQSKPEKLLSKLHTLQVQYDSCFDEDERKKLFHLHRLSFNVRTGSKIEQSALLIFLNKTCYNGLYRVNSKNKFNVPFGQYKKPKICDEQNILAISEALQGVHIICGDYKKTKKYQGDKSVFYLDPPYRPLSTSSSFNHYASRKFDDKEQIKLKAFCEKLGQRQTSFLLSNSDPKASNDDLFFDTLYKNFHIDRVLAKRSINSKGNHRGKLSEILVRNF